MKPDAPAADVDASTAAGIPYATAEAAESPYFSNDMAPTWADQRTWRARDFAVLWISMAACVPTYQLASGLIAEGMAWWQAVLAIFIGNVVVLVPMVLNAHAGTKYGIPFPVYCRASFGILGANIPALLRAMVACGWFGIQTWIGGWAIYSILSVHFTSWAKLPPIEIPVGGVNLIGINAAQIGCFLFFWLINMAVIYKGINSIRVLLNIKAPLLLALGLVLLAWAYTQADGFGPMLSQPSNPEKIRAKHGSFLLFFVAAVTSNIAFWSTLSLNIPDFTRYARSQRAQVLGQAVGLPPTMALFAFIGVAVTSATVIIYKEAVWDPIVLVTRFKNPAVLVIALAALCVATLATNIAANVVSPANDFAHLWPRRITFFIGGLITGLIGIAMHPWKLIADPSGYIFKWLIAYSALLGAVGGIMVTDYFVIRRTVLDLQGLYLQRGPYWYAGGFNWRAIAAFLAGILPCAPGFVGTVTSIPVPAVWLDLYNYAWFISFGVGAITYWLLSTIAPPTR